MYAKNNELRQPQCALRAKTMIWLEAVRDMSCYASNQQTAPSFAAAEAKVLLRH